MSKLSNLKLGDFNLSHLTLGDALASPWPLAAGALLGGLGVYYFVFRRKSESLPPGPTISWLGLGGKNAIKMPQAYAWLVFADWQKKFGDVIYVRVFSNPLLIINSQEAAFDLLEKKSAIYSSRPIRTMQAEVMGFSWLFSGLPYGPWYKQHRTMFHNHFQAKVIPKYYDTLVDSAHTLLRNLSRSPEALPHHLRRTTTAIVLHHVAEQGDEYVRLADQALAGVSVSANFGAYLVDYLPILKYIPAWFPGVQFKKDGQKWHKLGQEMWNRPFDLVKARMAEGSAESCVATAELENLFRDPTALPHAETLIKDVTATAYAAGSDTTLSILMSFFLAMVLHPAIQECAFAEIQHAIPDGDRLPVFADRAKLPYVDAIVWECLRWNPVGNVALAHYLTEDDVYRGYHIPKGTTVLANIWAMLHEPTRYPDPSTFNPDRFVGSSSDAAVNPFPELAYGFGRRICPGRFLATDTVWIVVASVLAAYKICKPLDENGKEYTPKVEYTPGLFSRPKPFAYRIVPRSEKTAALLAPNA
ncbi:cytochrome P450 [Mycena sp. CBHHK59/15]|nr:cytochrome P450 [Mycena sp. CBHHK59/15]